MPAKYRAPTPPSQRSPPKSRGEPPDGSSRDGIPCGTLPDRRRKNAVADRLAEAGAATDIAASMPLPALRNRVAAACKAMGNGELSSTRGYENESITIEELFSDLCGGSGSDSMAAGCLRAAICRPI